MALGIVYNIPIYAIFYLLKEDYRTCSINGIRQGRAQERRRWEFVFPCCSLNSYRGLHRGIYIYIVV